MFSTLLSSFSSARVDEPETLLNQCYKFVVRNLDSVFFRDPATDGYELIPGQALPREICEALIREYQLNGYQVDDKFIRLFKNTGNTSLRRVKIRNSTLSDDGFKTLLKHRLVELDISRCQMITDQSIRVLNEFSERLETLTVGSGVHLLPESLSYPNWVDQSRCPESFEKMGYILRAPNLKQLTIRNIYIHREKKYFPLLLDPFPNLVVLDLSGCSDVEKLEYIVKLPKLRSLTLHNVFRIQDSLHYICQLKNLVHLDISQSSEKMGIYQNENDTLDYIVQNLPALESLDISGTNLAGTGVAEVKGGAPPSGTDIPGLASRVSRPLEFLGLYGTSHAACRRHDIPAKRVSGDANEKQILTAAASYLERPDILQRVLNDLYQLFRYESCEDIQVALAIVLEAMSRHLTAKHIQISGSATLFYIVKNKDIPVLLSSKVKRAIVTTLLNGMNSHRNDDTMMRNGCLTLCQFKIPHDVLFEYKRLVGILLHIVSEMEQEGFVQRLGTYLLNSLACQVDGPQKQMLGDLGAVTRMLVIIDDRITRKVCDDVLEVAWSTMWNVTDETAINCQRFLDGKGMHYFLGCLQLFPEKDELMRNMMGLLGNVAEVKALRPRLMTHVYITVFADLVDSQSDGIEVSYNAAGVLSHLGSDGEEAWTVWSPSRQEVLARMVAAIERWPLDAERNINYRSFEPILNLAQVFHTPECQHWAVWALANLTTVYPNKYCSLVESEGGLEILREVMRDPRPYRRIKELAEKVLDKCDEYKDTPLPLDG